MKVVKFKPYIMPLLFFDQFYEKRLYESGEMQT